MAESLNAEEAQKLLDGVDAAFEAVLHGRYGGGVSAAFSPGSGPVAEPVILRTARAGTEAFVRLCLGPRGPGAGVEGIAIGTAQLTAGPGSAVEGATVQTEIFVDQDPNESGDATALSSGVLLECAPASLPNGGLLVVRSTEAGRNHRQLALAEQQNWRPNPSRHVSSSGLGASGRSHRQTRPAALLLPVSADLITRLAGAVAALSKNVGQVSVVLLPGDGSGG